MAARLMDWQCEMMSLGEPFLLLLLVLTRKALLQHNGSMVFLLVRTSERCLNT